MYLELADKYLNGLKVLDNNLESIERQRDNIIKGVNKVSDDIYSLSKPIDDQAYVMLANSKTKQNLKSTAIIGGVSLAVKAFSSIFNFVGETYANIKVDYLLGELIKKKQEVAKAKIGFAQDALDWSNKNIDKSLTILNKDISRFVDNYNEDKVLYFIGRKAAFERSYKCLHIHYLATFLIKIYSDWLNKADNYAISGKPTKKEVLNDLIKRENGIFGTNFSADNFRNELLKVPLKANVLLFLENEDLFEMIPLEFTEFLRVKKKLDKNSVANSAIVKNTTFIKKRKINQKKNFTIFISYSLILISITLLYYWNTWGWWNLLMVPLIIVLIIVAIIIRID